MKVSTSKNSNSINKFIRNKYNNALKNNKSIMDMDAIERSGFYLTRYKYPLDYCKKRRYKSDKLNHVYRILNNASKDYFLDSLLFIDGLEILGNDINYIMGIYTGKYSSYNGSISDDKYYQITSTKTEYSINEIKE